ncbi:pinopsin isoform X3 [Nomia melanderi]|uniref:pinopsin isoform X3 n=1 Tax=Nomia melanderi TaxID=2448451 RepID=UPI003FCE7936
MLRRENAFRGRKRKKGRRNSTAVPDDIHEDYVHPTVYIGAAVALGFIGFFGFTMNLMVAAVIVKDAQNLWTPVNVVLVNLVVGDFLVAALGNPVAMVSAITGGWYWGYKVCLWTAMILAFFVWIYALCLSLPPLVGWGSYGPEAGNVSCSVSWEVHDPVTKSESYIGFLFTFGLVIPVIVISSSYLAIILTLRKVKKRTGARGRRETKITKMVALMITAFLIAWSPYAALALAAQYFDAKPSASMAVLPALLAKSSICYNPIIYAGLNSQFPRSLKKIFDIRSPRSMLPDSQNTALTVLNRQEQRN